MTSPRVVRASRRILKSNLLLVCAMTQACSDEVATGSEGGLERVDSAGIELVLNRGDRGGTDAGALEVVEDLRIGALDGDQAELLFGDIRDVLVDKKGRIFVGNDQTATVRVFDENGTFVREFGGRGEGPSEIRSMINDMKWAGDQVVVIDWQGGGKSIVFDTSGAFAESWRHRTAEGERLPYLDYTPQGWVAVEVEPREPRAGVPGRAYPARRWVRRWSMETESYGDTLLELPPSVLYGSSTAGLDWGLFGGALGSAFDAEGNHYSFSGEDYRIDVRDPQGELVRSVRREYDATPITDEDVQEYMNRMTLRYDTMTGPDAARGRQRAEALIDRIEEQASFPRPATRPPLGALLVAPDGSFWVERQDFRRPAEWFQTAFTGFGGVPEVPTSWDLFSSDGRFLGNVVLPSRFSPLAVSSTDVVGVLRDDLDVEYVVRYRVRELAAESDDS